MHLADHDEEGKQPDGEEDSSHDPVQFVGSHRRDHLGPGGWKGRWARGWCESGDSVVTWERVGRERERGGKRGGEIQR